MDVEKVDDNRYFGTEFVLQNAPRTQETLSRDLVGIVRDF